MSAASASRVHAHGHGVDPDTRPLLGASAISAALGTAWVALVLFGPRGEAAGLLPEAEPSEVVVTLAPEPPPAPPTPAPAPPPEPAPPPPRAAAPEPAPPPPARAAPRPAPARTGAAPAAAPPASDLGSAFGGAGAPVADVGRVLGDVRVSGGSERAPAAGSGRAVITGADDAMRGTPGRGRTRAAGGADIGAVTAPSGGVARAEVRVSTPRALGGDGAAGGAARGDGARLGSEVRRRESQLRLCYTDQGLRADPDLAGRVTLALTVDASGGVTAADVTGRSWGGVGAAAAEACILERVRGWRFTSGAGRYELSFSFTR